MNVNGEHYRSIWEHPERDATVCIIDQRWLPHEFVVEELRTLEETATAIREMHLRGAPLIGIAAAYGMYLALANPEPALPDDFRDALAAAADLLKATRPTAVNLQWAVDQQLNAGLACDDALQAEGLLARNAALLLEEDVETCRNIGQHGLPLLETLAKQKAGETVNVLTHCNAGWLATADYGTATAPIYLAHDKGIPLHVWVDETRPRNQGARLTAWELGQHGVPHTVITDNAGGHLLQAGKVDVLLTGTDRTARNGDVANKIGTYLKALAAKANGVPFYVALPTATIDWELAQGVGQIPIEQRDPTEVTHIWGRSTAGERQQVQLTPAGSPAANYAFDVTPAALVTGLITDRGVCPASEEGLLSLYPERNPAHKFA